MPQNELLTDAAEIAALLSRDRRGYTVSELSHHFNMKRPKIGRLLESMIQTGWVDFDTTAKTYRIGRGLVELGFAATGVRQLTAVARPMVQAFLYSRGGGVDLELWTNPNLVFAQTICLDGSAQEMIPLGRRRAPAKCVAGIALLGALNATDAVSVIQGSAQTCEMIDSTLGEKVRLASEDGYFSSGNPGTMSIEIAAPIRNALGDPIAALTYLPTQDFASQNAANKIGRDVQMLGRSISMAMGFVVN